MEKGSVQLKYCPTENMIADIFDKGPEQKSVLQAMHLLLLNSNLSLAASEEE